MENRDRKNAQGMLPLINEIFTPKKHSPCKRSKTLGRSDTKSSSRVKRRGSAEGFLDQGCDEDGSNNPYAAVYLSQKELSEKQDPNYKLAQLIKRNPPNSGNPLNPAQFCHRLRPSVKSTNQHAVTPHQVQSYNGTGGQNEKLAGDDRHEKIQVVAAGSADKCYCVFKPLVVPDEKPRPKSLDGYLRENHQVGSGAESLVPATTSSSRSCEDFGKDGNVRGIGGRRSASVGSGGSVPRGYGYKDLDDAITGLFGILGEGESEEDDDDDDGDVEDGKKQQYEEECDAILETEDEDEEDECENGNDKPQNQELSVLCSNVVQHLHGLTDTNNQDNHLQIVEDRDTAEFSTPAENSTHSVLHSTKEVPDPFRLRNPALSGKHNIDRRLKNSIIDPRLADIDQGYAQINGKDSQYLFSASDENRPRKVSTMPSRAMKARIMATNKAKANGHRQNMQITDGIAVPGENQKWTDEKNGQQNNGLLNAIRNPCFKYRSQTLPERSFGASDEKLHKSKDVIDITNEDDFVDLALCNSSQNVNKIDLKEGLTKWNPSLDLTQSTDNVKRDAENAKAGELICDNSKAGVLSHDDNDKSNRTEKDPTKCSNNSSKSQITNENLVNANDKPAKVGSFSDDNNKAKVGALNGDSSEAKVGSFSDYKAKVGALNNGNSTAKAGACSDKKTTVIPNQCDDKNALEKQRKKIIADVIVKANVKGTRQDKAQRAVAGDDGGRDLAKPGNQGGCGPPENGRKVQRPTILVIDSNGESALENPGSSGGEVRPKSFLRDEVDEFEKIFTELFSSPAGQSIMGNELPSAMTASGGTAAGAESSEPAASVRHSLHEELFDKFCSNTGSFAGMSELGPFTSRLKSPMGDAAGEKLFSDLLDDLDNISQYHTDSARRRRKAREIFSDWLFSEGGKTPPPPPPAQVRTETSSPQNTPQHHQQQHHHPHPLQAHAQHQVPHRRKSAESGLASEARAELFSRWRPKSFEYLSEVSVAPSSCESCSFSDCKYTCHHKCRPAVTLDCPGDSVERAYENNSNRNSPAHTSATAAAAKVVLDSPLTIRRQVETSLVEEEQKLRCKNDGADDADSGYHTGNSTLQGGGGGAAPLSLTRPKGEYTLTREQLRGNIEKFNNNCHGLIMNVKSDSNMFEGFIRVHMNLIRPINMSLSIRPPSIYEVLANEEPEEEKPTDDTQSQIASFYLPKDTTKVIHIQSNTSTQEVIRALLTKFRITDNPRKFALYDKHEEPGKKAVMHKLCDDELPLPLCLSWIAEADNGLDTHKFVLQENDAGEILWDAFSIPELENFVRMLDKEEQEYLDQVRAKYQLMKIHMSRRMTALEKTRTQTPQQKTDAAAGAENESSGKDSEEKRSPVFV